MVERNNNMSPGDHIVAADALHTHHGIYLAPDEIVQYGSDDDKRFARVEIVTMSAFARGRVVRVVDGPPAFSPEDVRRRAESRLGEQDYSLFGNNCEHFVNWCRTGRHISRQVDRVVERAASAGTKALAGVVAKGLTRAGPKRVGRLAGKALMRGTSGWLIAADAAQLGTEVVMSQGGAAAHAAERAGRVVGLSVSLGIGVAVGGPLGAAGGGVLWCVGECVGTRLTKRATR